jgi:putative addiction module CopG family antidote
MTEISIPAEFRAFAREQVAAGRYASEGEVVADALRQYLADREALLALLDPAIAQLNRGEGRPFDAEDTKRRGRERRERAGALPHGPRGPLRCRLGLNVSRSDSVHA